VSTSVCQKSAHTDARLVVLFGWYRFICANGLVIGETKIEIKERHGHKLDIDSIPARIWPALQAVEADRSRMKKRQMETVAIDDIAAWSDEAVAKEWGKKAAARVFHICDAGKDIEIDDLFAAGTATEKPIRYLGPVPGCPERAETKFDVSQAMSFVATQRNNTEERVTWQAAIPLLLSRLATAEVG
jgi:Domain of unknown function (DUF932)